MTAQCGDNPVDTHTHALITELVIALGSNHRAEAAMSCAIARLQLLGCIELSDTIIGRDFTGRSRRSYHNACASLILNVPMSYACLQSRLKQIETDCGRDPAKKCAEYDYEVAMDLDILAVSIDGQWQMNPARLPLKSHDVSGVAQVAAFLLD